MSLLGSGPDRPEAAPPRGWARIGRFLAYDGTIPGGIAVALILGTSALLKLPVSLPLLVAAFCGTLVVYQLDRVLEASPEDHVNRPERTVWMRQHRRYVWGTVIGGAFGTGAMMPLLHWETIVLAGGLGLIGGLHVLPVVPGAHRLNIVGRSKPVVIATVWAVGAVMLPLLEAGAILTQGAMALAVYRVGIVGANLLVADAADAEGDRRVGLRSIATHWHPQQIRRMVRVLLVAILLVGGLAVAAFGAPRLLAVDLLGPLLMLAILTGGSDHPTWVRLAALDLVVAWPVVPFLLHLFVPVF